MTNAKNAINAKSEEIEQPFDKVLNSAATISPVNESKSKMMHSVNTIRNRSKFNNGNITTSNAVSYNNYRNSTNNSNSVLLSPNNPHSRKKHHRKLVSNNTPGNKATNQVSGFQA